MPTDIAKLFMTLGLSTTETKVYLASLSLGPTSVQDIAKESKLSRTATYDAVESLQKRGLLSTYERGKKRYFVAEEPEKAVAYFRENMHKMEDHLETFLRALPELKLQVGGEKPTVHFYEGDEGIFTLFRDVASVDPKELDEVSNVEDIYQHLDEKFLLEVRKIIDPTKMRYRLLVRGEAKNPRPGVEICRIPDELGTFHGDIWIYANRVAFVTFVGKPVCVIIESEPFAETARVLFSAAWQVCSMKK